MVRDLLQFNNLQKKVFAFLCAAIAVSGFFYAVLIKQTVAHVVDRRALETDISDMAAKVSELEGSYMTALQGVTLARAYALGFVDQDPALFVSRNDSELSLQYDGN
ncbi:MAG: hypothetical protein AAB458_00500 [Patescibacteria group bacterium]